MLSSNFNIENNRGEKYIGEDVLFGRRSRISYRIFRGILLILQALLYIAASSMYFNKTVQKSNGLRTGAGLFIAGASLRLIVEISKLIEDRVGIFLYGKYRQAYYYQRIEAFLYPNYALVEGIIRTELILSDLLLIIAAALDLARSILFIPSLNTFTIGKILYIVSSAILLVANLWIIYQIGWGEKRTPYNLIFRFRNLCRQPIKFLFRLISAIAAFFFLLEGVGG